MSGKDGLLYGIKTAQKLLKWGPIFRIRSDGSGYQQFHLGDAASLVAPIGASAESGLLQGRDGAIYGLGQKERDGETFLFRWNPPPPAPDDGEPLPAVDLTTGSAFPLKP